MAKYSSVVYNQTTYGQKSRLAFSVSPFTAIALDYGVIQLTWSAPVGGYSAFRLLRNQDSFSETVEDGITLYEEFGIDSGAGAVSISTLLDSAELDVPPITNGKYTYYTIWLLKSSDNVWYQAGQTYALAPNPHPTFAPDKSTFKTTHQKFLDLIPRVFTSGSYAPIDEANLNSDLSIFLKGFSFTVDEFLSALDSLLPNHQELKTSPEIVAIKANQLGLPDGGLLALKNQKKILRDALYVYSTKGTINALNTVAEDLTGYSVAVTVSPNLMLSVQDSTFYEGLGFWLAQGACTLTLEDVNPVTNEPLSIDTTYSAKVVATDSSAVITNGTDAPITKGVPVEEGVEYSLSLYSQTASSTGSFTTKIKWYDFQGTLLSTSTSSSHTVTTTWEKFTQTATAPSDAVYAGLEVIFTSGTYFIDMVQVAVSTATTYSEARCVTAFLEPTKTNYISNPSFEASNSAWSISGSSTATYETLAQPAQILEGTKVLQVTAGNFEATTDVAAGEVATGLYVTLSAYGKSEATTEEVSISLATTTELLVTGYSLASNVVTLSVRENHPFQVGDSVVVAGVDTTVNGSFTLTGVSGSTVSYAKTGTNADWTEASAGSIALTRTSSVDATLTPEWSRFQTRLLVPGEFLPDETSFVATLSGTVTDNVWFDAVQLEENYSATDYVDGNYSTERDALWAGTPNDSVSYVYPNKIVNISRLSSEIEKYIPFNTPWIIRSESATEASGIS